MMTSTNLRYSIEEPFTGIVDSFTDGRSWLDRRGIRLHQASDGNWQDVIGSDADVLLDDICAELKHARWIETTDWSQESLSDLVHHLIEAHHGYLAKELPRLLRLSERQAERFEEHAHIHRQFTSLTRNIFDHLIHEENHLFPLCLAVDQIRFGSPLPPGKRLRNILHEMHGNHDASLQSLRDIHKELRRQGDVRQHDNSHHYQNALLEGMAAVIADLEHHFAEESDVLLPGVSHLVDVFETRRCSSHPSSH
jgi:iron-sulfur cluster repair protein YtfE (RIC family)